MDINLYSKVKSNPKLTSKIEASVNLQTIIKETVKLKSKV